MERHKKYDKQTYKEDGQLEMVIKDDRMDTTGSTKPGCDLGHKVSMEDEENNTRS